MAAVDHYEIALGKLSKLPIQPRLRDQLASEIACILEADTTERRTETSTCAFCYLAGAYDAGGIGDFAFHRIGKLMQEAERAPLHVYLDADPIDISDRTNVIRFRHA